MAVTNKPFNPGRQQGVALIVTLVILLSLTILGVSSMRTSTLEERMAGNMRDFEVAFEAAEIALLAGEDYVRNLATTADFDSTGGTGGKFTAITSYGDTTLEAWQVESNWSSNYTAVNISNVGQSPGYIIQILDSAYGEDEGNVESGDDYAGGDAAGGNISIFKITSRGYGMNANTRVVLQSTYGKVLN